MQNVLKFVTQGRCEPDEVIAVTPASKMRSDTREGAKIPRFPAMELLRVAGDVEIGDPLHTAAMYEARARDALADARAEERAGRAASAVVFHRQVAEDISRAREVLRACVAGESAGAA